MTAERMEELLAQYRSRRPLKLMAADFGIAMSTVSYHATNAGLRRSKVK